MNSIEKKKKEAERKRNARLLESDEQKRVRREVDLERKRQYMASVTPEKKEMIQKKHADNTRKYRYATFTH
jgi:hypothetical protein